MRKIVIYDLAKKAYIAEVDGHVYFSYRHTDAKDFLGKGEANQFLIDKVLPLSTQRNEENAFWNDGFALTVLEVYI